jgi:hypothetical protein
MNNKYLLLFTILFFSIHTYAQQITIKGKVTDSKTNQGLSFANIRLAESIIGTAANINGDYELKVSIGNYKIIASYIGYYSDTVIVNTDKLFNEINFTLNQTEIDLPEIVINPGINPALEIIARAIDRKTVRNTQLKSYEVEAYTKGLIRTTEDISANNNNVSVGLGGNDSTELIISGILENHSKNYFEQPDKFKSIILARKQSANFPPTINTLTGGRLIQNFYENNINFLGRDLPGPIAENALDYYYFRIENITSQNDNKIYNIHIEPDNSADPGFVGNIFINDRTFDLVKVNLILNRAANTGGVFDTVNIFQQFDKYNDIYLPVDYRLFVKANVLGLVRIGFELNTILFDYKINQQIPETVFNKAIVTVLPEADKKDSTYWLTTPTIPNTLEEQEAYTRIDSIESAPKDFWDDFSFLNTRLSLTNNISISAPLAFYHFSRIEGHALDFGVFVDDAFNQRFNSSLQLSYGFSDKKFKQDFSSSYLLGDYRTWQIKVNAFNKIKILFEDSDSYNELFSTLVTLISKDEFRDYYYTRGFSFGIEGEVFPILKLNAGFNNKTDKSASVNSDFSFFNKKKTYRDNPSIYSSRINTLNFGFDLDFRDYIEDGFFRRRTSLGRSYILLSGDISLSNKNIFNSGLDFTTYEFNTYAYLRTFKSASLSLNLYTRFTDGATAYQDLYSLPGNIDVVFNSQTIRTLNLNEIVGDKILTFNLTHDFRDELFRMLNIPGLKNSEILLSFIFNSAIADVTGKTKEISPHELKTFKHPFYEAGFGVRQGILPFKLEFMWKLNYRDGNNFRVGLNMPLL